MLAPDLYKRIAAAKLFIDANYADAIDLGTVSREACLSPFHFHRLFSRVYRCTPHQYLRRRRMERAKVLLSLNKPVTEVCQEVGFESIGSFSSLFKKEIGYAPHFYRNLAHLKKQQAKEQPKRVVPHCFIEQLSIS
jgi:AraC-like DNA-binding protein